MSLDTIDMPYRSDIHQEHNIAAEHIRYSPSKDWFNIALPVSKVERLLDTEYYRYQNDRGEQVVRTTRYSLPRSLHAHIDTVQPTNYFSTPKTFESTLKVAEWDAPAADSRAFSRIAAPGYSNIGAVCNNTVGVTSLCVRTLYNTVDYVPQKPELNYAGTTNYLDQTV
jgi:tripeptidyl-peptidase-1